MKDRIFRRYPCALCARLLPLCAALLAAPVSAEEPAPPGGEVERGLALPDAGPPPPVTRTWLLNDEARIPGALQSIVSTRFSYSAGDSVSRPFASNLSLSHQTVEVGGELGLGRGFSIQAIGVQGQSSLINGQAVANGDQSVGALLGVRWSALPASFRSTQLVVSAGYLRDLNEQNGAWARLTFGQDLGAARLTASLHGEHLFSTGRDGLDLMLTAGATYRVWESLRLGVEYVGQDLEESSGNAAEGGARHIAGPVVSATFFKDHLSVVAGPAFTLGAQPGRALVRGGLAYSF
jgi:hypothetical protein